MQFIQNKQDGSCKITFTWRERFLLFIKGRLLMEPQSFRHFSNNLIKIVADWTHNFDEEVQRMNTQQDDNIKTK
jgi:hypothetical protein